jgi:hypothetical protein
MPVLIPDHISCVANSETYLGTSRINPLGWYHSAAGVVATPSGLVACYRRSDAHCAHWTDIMIAYSNDGGRVWHGHHAIAHSNVWEHRRVWVVPQISRLRDGRLVIVCDQGHRGTDNDWPMLTHWQQPNRGMANFLFWSHDDGRSWSAPHPVDEVGGQPGYIHECADGTLLFTRTESMKTDVLENPPLPWGPAYYRCVVVASVDGGRTWAPRGILSDDPFHSDGEVGLLELRPGRLMALSRIGYSGGNAGQPSRVFFSEDGGRNWSAPQLAPVYAQRPIIGQLPDGRVLATYRDISTPGNWACAFDPERDLRFEPAAWIWDEERCHLADGELVLDTASGPEAKVEFGLYPALDSRARVELSVTLRLEPGHAGATVHAGLPVTLFPNRLEATMPDGESVGCACDLTRPRTLRVLRAPGQLALWLDGELQIERAPQRYADRLVRFGASQPGRSFWHAASAKVENVVGHNMQWDWQARDGYPDAFRRTHAVCLSRSADCGYGGWAIVDDGVVVVDYTNRSSRPSGYGGGPIPVLEAYRLDSMLLQALAGAAGQEART